MPALAGLTTHGNGGEDHDGQHDPGNRQDTIEHLGTPAAGSRLSNDDGSL